MNRLLESTIWGATRLLLLAGAAHCPLIAARGGRGRAWLAQLHMVQYYFKGTDGPNLGPMGAAEFRQRQEAGEITDKTMVWRSGMVEWITYAALHSAEMVASQSSTKASRPLLPVRKARATSAAVSPKPGFVACAGCGQEWAETMLFADGNRKICGNCQNRLQEKAKSGRPEIVAGSSVTAWFFITMAIVSMGYLTFKIMHPGPPVPRQRAAEFTAPSTYKK